MGGGGAQRQSEMSLLNLSTTEIMFLASLLGTVFSCTVKNWQPQDFFLAVQLATGRALSEVWQPHKLLFSFLRCLEQSPTRTVKNLTATNNMFLLHCLEYFSRALLKTGRHIIFCCFTDWDNLICALLMFLPVQEFFSSFTDWNNLLRALLEMFFLIYSLEQLLLMHWKKSVNIID